MAIPSVTFPVILFGLAQMLKHTRRRYPVFRARLKERNLVAQIKTRDGAIKRLKGDDPTEAVSVLVDTLPRVGIGGAGNSICRSYMS